MNYYIVSEEELRTIILGRMDSRNAQREADKAEAACRARPVPEWAAGFCSEPIETSSDYPIIEQFEEIKR